jgi:hypothetical protein
MMSFEKSTLWQSAFGPKGDDTDDERGRFRRAYISLRTKAEDLVSLIVKDMPDYTVHDISHLDALWEVGSQIAGANYPLNPAEGFVLGGAILLHDAAMTVAAFPNGIEELRATTEWKDALSIRQQGGATSSAELERAVLADVLRQLHATRARTLPTQSWKSPDGKEHYLIDDADFRAVYAETIGAVAESHWMPVEILEGHLPAKLGAFPEGPADWSVDVLKVACLLRIADANHVDARRAPQFLRTLIRPAAGSDDHWAFQGRLPRPVVENEALVFTSGSAFPEREANAWWVCFDTINMINKELIHVDAFLAASGRRRLAARRVEGAESPRAFRRFVRTEGWEPVDTRLHVSDVPSLVELLGGRALYGNNPQAVLRELLQNAADAVRARRLLTHGTYSGSITVRLVETKGQTKLEVEDDGVGMSEFVLINVLLDFGKSLWRSHMVQREFPGLASAGMQAAGRFGIGFFSVFMLGQHIAVFTRRFDRGVNEQLTLEFMGGARIQPILRRSVPRGYVENGGTCVSITLTNDPKAENGLLSKPYHWWQRDSPLKLQELIHYLCPCLDINVDIVDGDAPQAALVADDWKTMPATAFLQRLSPSRGRSKYLSIIAKMVRPIVEDDDQVVGRAVLRGEYWDQGGSAIIDAGMRVTTIPRIAGVLLGTVTNAARSEGNVAVSPSAIKRWASEQRELFSKNKHIGDDEKLSIAATLAALDVDVGRLPIIRHGEEFWTKKDFISHIEGVDSITFVSEDQLVYDDDDDCSSSLYDDDFVLRDDLFVIPEISSGWPRHFGGRLGLQIAEHELKVVQHSPATSSLYAVFILRLVEGAWGGKLQYSGSIVTIGDVEGVDIDRRGLCLSRVET